WQYYHGYCILVARRHATELSQFTADERHGFFDEMCTLAKAIETCFQPRKLNYELLGNQVPHLHWHLFPRQGDDPELLKPVWLALDRAERDEKERRRLQTGPISRAETIALLKRQRKGDRSRHHSAAAWHSPCAKRQAGFRLRFAPGISLLWQDP